MKVKNEMKNLRNILFDELKSLRCGKSDTARAIAVSKLAAQTINAKRTEHIISTESRCE